MSRMGSVVAWLCGCVGGVGQILAWVVWVHKILAWVAWVEILRGSRGSKKGREWRGSKFCTLLLLCFVYHFSGK